MHDYVLEYDDDDGQLRSICFSAIDPSGAFKYAEKIGPGRGARLRDGEKAICRIERIAETDVWLVERTP